MTWNGFERQRDTTLCPTVRHREVHMVHKWFIAFIAATLLTACSANAQGVLGIATQAKDLTLPSAPSATTAANGSRMALLKPNGPDPFPAVVLHHP